MKTLNLSVSASILSVLAISVVAPVGAQELNDRQLNDRQMDVMREREERGEMDAQRQAQKRQAQERQAQERGVPKNPDHRYTGEYEFNPKGSLTPFGGGFREGAESVRSIFNLAPSGVTEDGQPKPVLQSVQNLGFIGEGKGALKAPSSFNIHRTTPSGAVNIGGETRHNSTLRSTSPNGDVWSSEFVEIPEVEDLSSPGRDDLVPGDITHDVSAGVILQGPGEVSASTSGTFDIYLNRGDRRD